MLFFRETETVFLVFSANLQNRSEFQLSLNKMVLFYNLTKLAKNAFSMNFKIYIFLKTNLKINILGN